MQTVKFTGAIVAALALASLAACGEHNRDANPLPKADPSAVVIGTAPAAPSGDPPGTTPVADASRQVSKEAEQAAMPLPGQANDHSNDAHSAQQTSDSGATKGQTQ
jgi:hypothetical protein